ncbi:putative bicyclomycin resistance protein [Talaromyces proteolyticus]|uniref:Bicyclomycin resistance protein n=1 Tax=Talaromyces proteolyticus TaxID=1131652 RepID=A0AAD4KK55_9EURO|nr:putative bicyclomycin resistance protein [Talaromyces proteolyticus]KAH8692123.1 putative bicyclomycin resistance protein [Talaromyces proteolyticus]
MMDDTKRDLSQTIDSQDLKTLDREKSNTFISNPTADVEIQSAQRADGQAGNESKVSRFLKLLFHRTNREGLRHELLPITNLDENTVGWESQEDPDMPLNFSKREKWIWVGLLSTITLLTPFATSILSPAIDELNKEFGNSNAIVGSMTVSIYLLGYVIGPIFVAPLSEIYGRKPVLDVSNAFFCLWQIGCALAPNIETLIVCRFFSGVGGVACLTLGGSVIGDLFRPDQRAFAIGMWNVGPLIGPTIGPLLGGFITDSIGWRYDFWIVLAAATLVTALIAILNKETSHQVLIQRKTLRLQKELGRYELKSCYKSSESRSTTGTTRTLIIGLIRPLKMLVLSPIVFFLSLYIAFVFGTVYLLYTTIPTVFQDIYGFDPGQTGLVYLALGLGNVLGWLVITFFSDKMVIRLSQANDGVFEPEMRLTISIYFGIFLPITLFWYGWSSYYRVNLASTIISLIPYGFGIMGLFLPITTYLVDSYPIHAASAIAANVILRSVVGALLPLAGPPMYASLGLGWGNSLLGFICVIMIPLPFIFYKFGARLRKAQRSEF